MIAHFLVLVQVRQKTVNSVSSENDYNTIGSIAGKKHFLNNVLLYNVWCQTIIVSFMYWIGLETN